MATEAVASLTSLMRRWRLLLFPSLTGAVKPEGGQTNQLDRHTDRGFYFPAAAQITADFSVRGLCLSLGGGAHSRYPLETIKDKIRSLRSKTDGDDQSEAVWRSLFFTRYIGFVAPAEAARGTEGTGDKKRAS